jgi:hypothetical protein
MLAFTNKTDGIRIVKGVLAGLNAQDGFTREFLEDASGELTEVGLSKLATLVAKKAETLPSQLDLCPYPVGSLDEKCWLRSTQQRLEQRERKRRRRLGNGKAR